MFFESMWNLLPKFLQKQVGLVTFLCKSRWDQSRMPVRVRFFFLFPGQIPLSGYLRLLLDSHLLMTGCSIFTFLPKAHLSQTSEELLIELLNIYYIKCKIRINIMMMIGIQFVKQLFHILVQQIQKYYFPYLSLWLQHVWAKPCQ